jgi:DNA polymerase-3 subunit delta
MFHFIAGADDFLVQQAARAEWETLAKDIADPHSLEIIDGQAGNVDEVDKAVSQFIAALQTVSMFSPEKAIWFRQITFLADSVTGRAKGTTAAIERLQAALESADTSSIKVLLSASPVDRRKKIYKWLQKAGQSRFLDAARDDSALIEMLEAEARAQQKSFAPNAAQILVELTAGNTRLALGETQKLITWLGEDTVISTELVTEMVPSVPGSDFFEAAEAFYSLNLPAALNAIRRHFFAGHDARPLITSLQNRNRLMLQLKALEAGRHFRGRPSKSALEKAAQSFSAYFGDPNKKDNFNVFTQNPWYLSRLAESAGALTLKHLVEFQKAFRSAFMEIIRRPNEQEAVISAMAVNCLSSLQIGRKN